MPKIINEPPPNVDAITVEWFPGETPEDIEMICDGSSLWIQGAETKKVYARRKNKLWVNIVDN